MKEKMNIYMILLSANNIDEVKEQANLLLKAVNEGKFTDDDLINIAYTLQIGRKALKARIAFTAISIADIADKLEYVLLAADSNEMISNSEKKVYYGTVADTRDDISSSYVEKYIHEGDIDSLLRAWISGAYIPWRKIYDDSHITPRRIPLPVYSFAPKKKHYTKEDYARNTSNPNIDKKEILLYKPIWIKKDTDDKNGITWKKRFIILIGKENEVLSDILKNSSENTEYIFLRKSGQSVVSRYEDYIVRLSREVRSVIKSSSKGNVLIQIVIRSNYGEYDARWQMKGISSFFKTVEAECSSIRYQFIIMEDNVSRECIEIRLTDNSRDSSARDILYRNGNRYVYGLENISSTNNRIRSRVWKDNGIYLITGGLGKLGLLFAEEIAECTSNAVIVLTGRRETDKESSLLLEKMNSGKCSVIYRRADISEKKDVEELISWITGRYGNISGIIHTAGIINDNLILRKTDTEYIDVMRPKTRGTYYLDLCTKNLKLDYFVCFSSATSILGNIGQSDYTAANGFMDAFAYCRSRLVESGKRYGKTVSVNWPLWNCGGMSISPELEELMYKKTGLVAIDRKSGLDAFYTAMEAYSSQVLVLPGNINRIQCTLSELYEMTDKLKAMDELKEDAVAIIGMSARFPEADDIESLWENLKSGISFFKEIPQSRWNMKPFFESNKDKARKEGKSYCKWGCFLKDFDKFDPLFFNISPSEAERMDPQERLFLEECWKALEDSGYIPSKMSKEEKKKSGIYGAVTKTGFQLWNYPYNKCYNTSFASFVNKVSYFMDFSGPSKVIDTMCSSYITALHEACKDLKYGEIDMAVVGGANLYLHPYNFVLLSHASMLADSPESPVFRKNGSGFMPSEGVGAVVLKRLSDAERDSDDILAVIDGSAVLHSGKTNGYGVPNPRKLSECMTEAIVNSGVDPKTIRHLEAAANGSEISDMIEMSAITKMFSQLHDDENGYYTLGSVKSILGHGEAVSGLAQLIKTVLQLRYRKILPTKLAEDKDENILPDKLPFRAEKNLKEWEASIYNKKKCPRRVLINSIGAGGVYASVVLEEYTRKKEFLAEKAQCKNVFCFSAKSMESLTDVLHKWVSYFEKKPDADLDTISYILNVRREGMKYRFAPVAENRNELIHKIRRFINDEKVNEKNKVNISEQVIEEYIRDRRLEELADLWERKADVSWNRLYEMYVPKHISQLPVYEFRKKSFWVNSLLMSPELSVKAESSDEINFISLEDLYATELENIRELSETVPEKRIALSKDEIQNIIKNILYEILYLDDSDDYDVTDSFEDLGVDSVYAKTFIKLFNEKTGLLLNETRMFSYPSIEEFSAYCAEQIK